MTDVPARGGASGKAAVWPLVTACADGAAACPVLASLACQALLRHVVVSTGSSWGVWCVPQPDSPGEFTVLWSDAAGRACVFTRSDDAVRRVFGSALASGVPAVCAEVPPPWRGLLAGSAAACADDWRSLLAVALAETGDSRVLLGLANRAGGYEPGHVDVWRPVFDALAAVAVVDGVPSAPLQVADVLQGAEQRFRLVFEHAAVGIARVSTAGVLLDVNPALCETLGRSRRSLLGAPMRELTHPDDWPGFEALLQALRDGRQVQGVHEKRYLRPDGSTVWARVAAGAVHDGMGRVDHCVAVIENVTERKRYEEGMALTQVAERASRAKSEFLSRMSHELRTPLNAMLGFAQLLRADAAQPLSSTQRAKLEHIERAGAQLMAIIGDVLDLSRIEAGGMALSIETLRVASVIDDALNLVSAQARATGIQLRYTPPPPGSEAADYCVRGDLVRLRQALSNLLSNAIKYNLPGGSVRVEVAREPAGSGSGDRIVITVTDNGPGLSAEQQARLFEPFNRLGAERSGVEGSGIGLVIVRKLVELMGGSVAVRSELGRGSSFTLRLPATSLSQRAQQAAAPVVTPDAEPPLLVAESMPEAWADNDDGPHAFTVLYAEDNEVNVELVRQVMRMRPTYRLIVAHSGAQAIELVRAQRPDVLLLDMHLGDMTGIDVVTALDREPATAGIPRLALSADAMPDHIRTARQYGFNIYLTKPLDVSALLSSLDDFAQASGASLQ